MRVDSRDRVDGQHILELIRCGESAEELPRIRQYTRPTIVERCSASEEHGGLPRQTIRLELRRLCIHAVWNAERQTKRERGYRHSAKHFAETSHRTPPSPFF
jgi:hypothetical protein